jgi:cytochrome P450 family 4 subfamily B polypeptide 1
MILLPLILWTISFSLIAWVIYKKVLYPWDDLPSIPGPKPQMLLGNLLLMMKYSSLEAAQTDFVKQYGPVFRLCFPLTQMITVGDSEILKGTLLNYKSPTYSTLHPLIKNGLVTSEDDKWKHDRKLLDHAFSFKYLRGLHPTIIKYTHELIKKWESYPDGAEVNATIDFTNYTFDIIGEVAINSQFNALQSGDKLSNPLLINFVSTLTEMAYRDTMPWNRLNFMAKKRMEKSIKLIEEEVLRKVNERRKQNKESSERKNDILDILLTTNEKTGEPEFTDIDIIHHLNTFLFAGHDTTAVLLSMTFYALGGRPDIKKKILEEIEPLRSKGFVPSYDDLSSLNYIGMVLNESLRLYPPASSARALNEESAKLFGIKDSSKLNCPNTYLHLASYVSHINPKYWDEPLEYNPERFSVENTAKRDPLAFIPFLAGPRKCIGNNFALMEAKTAMAMLLPRFDWKIVQGHDIGWGYQIVSKPLKGVKIILEKKKL